MLELGTEDINIALPNGDSVALLAENFSPGSGYYISDDDEVEAGDPPFYIPAGTDRNQLSYNWRLSTDDYDILINFNQGLIYAYINGNNDRYIIKKASASEQYIMRELNLPAYPFDDGDPQLQQAVTGTNRLNQPQNVGISHLKSFRGDLITNARASNPQHNPGYADPVG